MGHGKWCSKGLYVVCVYPPNFQGLEHGVRWNFRLRCSVIVFGMEREAPGYTNDGDLDVVILMIHYRYALVVICNLAGEHDFRLVPLEKRERQRPDSGELYDFC